MKLPVTEQFLLKIFRLIHSVDRAYDFFAPHTMKESLVPELLKFRREFRRKEDWKSFSQLVYHLKRKGYIRIQNLEHKQGVLLTRRGAEKVLKIQGKIAQKQKRKDGKWQMVIFDIPEKKKGLREILRGALRAIGYERLQDSVWMCPYEVEKETEGTIREYGVDPYVKVFLIEEVDI
ncbi:MAG: CRISPR-associated endonuclease Cas2 [Candidatus Wildermuthbacteria bacterium]|nr:CRISPR-associated endonuclease Cas2 [Candidatus Wildermuthbacteria bacterium]